ncbi:hypothetical protein IE53DRAFT_372024, partial [Violaceomyces palustris]
TGLIASGAVLIGYFGVVQEPPHSLDELLSLYARPAFVAFATIFVIVFIGVLAIAHLAEWQLHMLMYRSNLPPTRPSKQRAGGGQHRSTKSRLRRRWSAPSLATVAEVSESSSGIATPVLAIADEAARRGVTLESLRNGASQGNQVMMGSGSIQPKSSSRSLSPSAAANVPREARGKMRNYGTMGQGNFPSTAPNTIARSGGFSSGMNGRRRRERERKPTDPPKLQSTNQSKALDDKVVKRTRLGLSVVYGGASGTLSGACLLLAKSGVELLMLTFAGSNQFKRWQSWMLVVIMLAAALLQLWYLNKALKLADPTLVCPLAFCFYNTSSIALGLVYFNQLGSLAWYDIILVVLGTAVLLTGVWVVSLHGEDEAQVRLNDGILEVGNGGSTTLLSANGGPKRPSLFHGSAEETEALLANAAGVTGPHLPLAGSPKSIDPTSEGQVYEDDVAVGGEGGGEEEEEVFKPSYAIENDLGKILTRDLEANVVDHEVYGGADLMIRHCESPVKMRGSAGMTRSNSSSSASSSSSSSASSAGGVGGAGGGEPPKTLASSRVRLGHGRLPSLTLDRAISSLQQQDQIGDDQGKRRRGRLTGEEDAMGGDSDQVDASWTRTTPCESQKVEGGTAAGAWVAPPPPNFYGILLEQGLSIGLSPSSPGFHLQPLRSGANRDHLGEGVLRGLNRVDRRRNPRRTMSEADAGRVVSSHDEEGEVGRRNGGGGRRRKGLGLRLEGSEPTSSSSWFPIKKSSGLFLDQDEDHGNDEEDEDDEDQEDDLSPSSSASSSSSLVNPSSGGLLEGRGGLVMDGGDNASNSGFGILPDPSLIVSKLKGLKEGGGRGGGQPVGEWKSWNLGFLRTKDPTGEEEEVGRDPTPIRKDDGKRRRANKCCPSNKTNPTEGRGGGLLTLLGNLLLPTESSEPRIQGGSEDEARNRLKRKLARSKSRNERQRIPDSDVASSSSLPVKERRKSLESLGEFQRLSGRRR